MLAVRAGRDPRDLNAVQMLCVLFDTPDYEMSQSRRFLILVRQQIGSVATRSYRTHRHWRRINCITDRDNSLSNLRSLSLCPWLRLALDRQARRHGYANLPHLTS